MLNSGVNKADNIALLSFRLKNKVGDNPKKISTNKDKG